MNPCPKHGTHMDACHDCCEEYWRSELEAEVERLKDDMRIMVEKAADKHRPAYDEQQSRIAELEQKLRDSEGRCKSRDKVIYSLEVVVKRQREALEKVANHSADVTGGPKMVEIANAALTQEVGDE